MASFILTKILISVSTIIAALALIFLAVSAIPGDAAEAAVRDSTLSADALRLRRESFALDKPLWDRFVQHILTVTRGDWGTSWYGGEKVSDVIGGQFLATAELASSGLVVAVAVGAGTALIGLVGPHKRAAQFVNATVVILLALPSAAVGTGLILVFSLWLRLFPGTDQGTPASLVLPSLVIGLSVGPVLSRALLIAVRQVASSQIITFAQAKGLTHFRAILHHGLPMVILPLLETIALLAGYLLGGTAVVETMFARQGLGRTLVNAAINNDLPVIRALVFLSIVVIVVTQLILDITYAMLDPRSRPRTP